MKVKKHDHIEIDFVGRLKENNQIFDLTEENVAKENNIYDSKLTYKPLIVCVGEEEVVKGLDKEFEGKETGKEYTIEIKPEEGFGKKDAKLIKLMPISAFKNLDRPPVPGLQVVVDNLLGTIKTVTGGRVIVDFNHPLAGRGLIYKIKINRIVTDDKEKFSGLLTTTFKEHDIKFSLDEGRAEIELNVPKVIQDRFIEKVLRLIPSIKSIAFKTTTEE